MIKKLLGEKIILPVILIFIVILAIPILRVTLYHPQESTQRTFKSPPSIFSYTSLSRNIDKFLRQGDIESAIGLAQTSFKKKEIQMSQCHILLHIVGHKAYSLFPDDLKKLARTDSMLCGHAFQHGIEAEIAASSKDYVSILQKYCSQMQKTLPGITCYHGAGHSFMHESLDLNSSLQSCDNLQNGPVKDLEDCYKGVFSEYAFQVEGIDGDTGLPIPGGAAIKLPVAHPLDLCQSLTTKYQYACGSQLSRILMGEDVESSLLECTNGNFNEDLKAACIQVISAVFAQGGFSQNNPLTIPQIVLAYPKKFKESYLYGMVGEYRAYENSGLHKDWKSICSTFEMEEDVQFCNQLVQS